MNIDIFNLIIGSVLFGIALALFKIGFIVRRIGYRATHAKRK